MFLGRPCWYALCISCGYREVRRIPGVSPPSACPHCNARENRFPVRFGRYMRDRRIRREDADLFTEPVPLGVSRV